MADTENIIIIKKKKGGHGHHGGAWKVAYADFVTAMMALFIVLWLLNTSKPTQEAVGGYFRDPKGTSDKKGTDKAQNGNAGASKKDDKSKKEDMAKLEEKLEKALKETKGFEKLKDQVEMTLTAEGLKIEFLEKPNGTFFENGKAQPTPALAMLLGAIAAELAKLPNPLLIEGHTDAKPYAAGGYGNWELSADRANMARRMMEDHGVKPVQFIEVRGFAERQLRKPSDPLDSSNRRVTLLIQYADDKPSGAAVEYTGTKPLSGEDVKKAEEENKPAPAEPTKGEKPAPGEKAVSESKPAAEAKKAAEAKHATE